MKLEDDLGTARIEELLQEAVDSGEPVLLTEPVWDAMLQEARALVDSRRRNS